MPILVKFKAIEHRQQVFRAKSKLEDRKKDMYINEDLSKKKSELYKKVRQLRKDGFIWKSWTMNSEIYITTNEEDDNLKLIHRRKDRQA